MKLTGAELLKEFKDHGISQDAKDTRFTLTLEFQDFIGHMNKSELRSFYQGLDQTDRKHFIWACSVCLSPDTLIDVLKSTTILLERERLYDDFDQDISEREDKLFTRLRTFQDCKKPIHKKLASLKAEISALRDRMDYHRTRADREHDTVNRMYKRNAELESKACDLDNLKSAFALLSV